MKEKPRVNYFGVVEYEQRVWGNVLADVAVDVLFNLLIFIDKQLA